MLWKVSPHSISEEDAERSALDVAADNAIEGVGCQTEQRTRHKLGIVSTWRIDLVEKRSHECSRRHVLHAAALRRQQRDDGLM